MVSVLRLLRGVSTARREPSGLEPQYLSDRPHVYRHVCSTYIYIYKYKKYIFCRRWRTETNSSMLHCQYQQQQQQDCGYFSTYSALLLLLLLPHCRARVYLTSLCRNSNDTWLPLEQTASLKGILIFTLRSSRIVLCLVAILHKTLIKSASPSVCVDFSCENGKRTGRQWRVRNIVLSNIRSRNVSTSQLDDSDTHNATSC